MLRLFSTQPPLQHYRIARALILLIPLLAFISVPLPVDAAGLQEITEILSHPEQYDRQEVVVTGQVTNIQLATNREGQPAYGFLLKSQAGTLKVISLGQVEVREGDQVSRKSIDLSYEIDQTDKTDRTDLLFLPFPRILQRPG